MRSRANLVRWVGICGLTLFLGGWARAQQYPFLPISAPGLPHGCMFPFFDHQGALWLAGCEPGSEGLFYFDGARFISPVKDPFPKAIVRGMVEDTDGGLWIASSKGIYRFERGHLQKEFDGSALAGIAQVARDVFLATIAYSDTDPLHQAALTRISKVGGNWKAETIQQPVPQIQYRLDRTDHVLYGCLEGYCEIAAGDLVTWKPGQSLQATRHVADTGLNSTYAVNQSIVWRDRLGCVWWRERTNAAYQCPSDPKPVPLPISQASLGFPSLFELSDGTIGLPSYGKLTVGRPGKLRVLNGSNGCPNALFAAAGKDDSIWITSTSGLFVFPFHTKLEFWSARDGLRGTVWSVLHEGNDVLATADVYSEILDGDRSHWRVLHSPAGRFYRGPDNSVIVASTAGVAEMSSRGKVLRRSAELPIWLLTRARDGSDWAAGTGVYELIPKGGTFLSQPKAPGQQFIQGIAFDREGTLWTCSWSGLSHLDQSGWHTLSQKDGLLQNGCGSMTVDSDDNIWYAYDTLPGFALIQDPKAEHPAIRQFQNEVANNRTYFFAYDRRGWLWRGTPDGIYVADLAQARQGEWLHLNRTDGLPAVDTNQNSVSEDSDGSIWFGAENSVIHISPPDDLLHPQYAPSIFLSSFSLNGGPAEMADGLDQIKSGADVVAHVGSLQFDRRNSLRLRYRILPEKSEWTTQSDLDIHVGHMRSGSHLLEVQAQLGSGPWSATTGKSFAILKPIWMTWPAILSLIVTGGIGFAGVRNWRQRRNQRAAKLLPELAEWRLAALSPEMQHLEGMVLDSRFEVGRVLARGGFALVTEGKDLQQRNRLCAVKIFRQELVDKEWIAKRFQHEVSALQQISHPNVVSIHGHGTTPGGAPYLVMEFVKGETLREKLDAGVLTRSEIASCLRQMGSALGEIHSRGICHRDLKPENLMIRSSSSPGSELVLIDFSIAIVKDPDETLHGLSRAAGTLYYMAPEQAIGYADASSDIYSLAKILIEMLTGQRLSALLPDASIDLPARVREFLSQPSFGLSIPSIDLISKALEFDPFRRPKDAGKFASVIAADLESSSVAAASC